MVAEGQLSDTCHFTKIDVGACENGFTVVWFLCGGYNYDSTSIRVRPIFRQRKAVAVSDDVIVLLTSLHLQSQVQCNSYSFNNNNNNNNNMFQHVFQPIAMETLGPINESAV